VSDDPLKHTAEIAIVSPRCRYRMVRTAARLRHGLKSRVRPAAGPSRPAPMNATTRHRARDDR